MVVIDIGQGYIVVARQIVAVRVQAEGVIGMLGENISSRREQQKGKEGRHLVHCRAG
jgi:DUF1009 family protein